jgi:hypothetical protein
MDRAFLICCDVIDEAALRGPALGCDVGRECSLKAMDGCVERGLGAVTGLLVLISG